MALEMALDESVVADGRRGSRRKIATSMSSGPIIKPAVRQKIEDHGLSVEEVEAAIRAPEQQVPGHSGRLVMQSRAGRFLIRVIIEQDRDPPEVVTAYRTRDIQKYWQVSDAD